MSLSQSPELSARDRAVAGAEREPEGGWPAFLDDLEAIVWEADPETFEFSFVSAEAERLLGYPPEEWLSEPGFWEGIIDPDDRHETVEACRAGAATGTDHDLEYRVIRRDGSVTWLRDVVRIVTLGDGGQTPGFPPCRWSVRGSSPNPSTPRR